MNLAKTVLLFFPFLIGYHALLHSQSNISFKRYTTADGLPHNVGFDILQTKDRFIWIGTDDGMARFDGFEFKAYNEAQGFKGAYVIALAESKEGELLVGSYKQGVHVLKDATLQQMLPKGAPKILKVDDLGNGKLLIGSGIAGNYKLRVQDSIDSTYHSIVFFFNDDQLKCFVGSISKIKIRRRLEAVEYQQTISLKDDVITLKENSLKKSLLVYSYHLDIDNRLVLLTNYGLFQILLTENQQREQKIKFSNFGDEIIDARCFNGEQFASRFTSQVFYSIHKDKNANYWLGGNGRLVRFSPEEQSFELFTEGIPKENIFTLSTSSNGIIFFATSGPAIGGQKSDFYAFNPEGYSLKKLNKDLNIISAISMLEADDEGNIWVTTHGDGLYCIYPSRIKNYSITDGLSNSFVTSVVETKNGLIWVTTQDGLNYYDGKVWRQHPYFKSTDLSPGLKLNSKGQLFTSGKIGKQFNIFEILPDRPGIPSGLGGGSFFIDPFDNFWSKDIMSHIALKPVLDNFDHELPTSDIALQGVIMNSFRPGFSSKRFTMLYDTKDSIWIGSENGLNLVQKNNVTLFTREDGLPSNAINEIKKGPAGDLWLATEAGLYNFTKKLLYTEEQGLLSNRCRNLFFDHRGTLWIGSPKGLNYFDFQHEVIGSLNSRNGIITDDINCIFEDSQHQLWLGTSRGVSVLDNNKPPSIIEPPHVFLNQVSVNREAVLLDMPTKVPHNSQIEISYSSFSFRNPDGFYFQIRLNKEEPWVTTKNRSIVFQNLEPGNYHFQVRAKKFDSTWGQESAFNFTVQSPWWQSGVFIFIVAMFFVGFAMYLFWRQRIKLQHKTEQAQLELNVLRSQMNPHFIFNSLNAIMHYIMGEDKFKANLYLSNFSQLMRMYLDASKTNYISLSEELKLLRLYIDMEMLRFKDKFDFQLKIDDNLILESIEIPSMLLQPFAENAINHGLAHKKEKGLLVISIKPASSLEKILLTIEDNGIGRVEAAKIRKASHKRHKSHALHSIEDRIKLLNNSEPGSIKLVTIDLVDEKGKTCGTKIQMEIMVLQ